MCSGAVRKLFDFWPPPWPWSLSLSFCAAAPVASATSKTVVDRQQSTRLMKRLSPITTSSFYWVGGGMDRCRVTRIADSSCRLYAWLLTREANIWGMSGLDERRDGSYLATTRHRGSAMDVDRRDRRFYREEDHKVGDFEKADVLIEGKKIVAVGPSLGHAGGEQIDCSGAIVMPGFISTHNHQYECLQRSIIPDGIIVFAGNAQQQSTAWPYEAYGTVVQSIWTAGRLPDPVAPGTFLWDLGRSPYDPQDCYISELVACLSQITQGVTMGTDTSQASHTPEYSDAMIQGLMDSGRRMVYDYTNGTDRGLSEFPGASGDATRGIGRLAKTYFNSKDQLVTLGFAGGPGPAFAGAPYTGWQLGREFGALINNHNVGGFQTIINAAADPRNGTDWSDVTQVHCVRWQDNASAQISIDALTSQSRAWEIFAANGGHSSIAVIIEMQMRHGMPPIQMALDHGILPSLSPDVETNMTTDPFSMKIGRAHV